MRTRLTVQSAVTCVIVVGIGLLVEAATQQGLGYKDTPNIPGTPYCVHDGTRPQPRVVTPGAAFSQGAAAPSDAVVLFDGKDLSKWASNQGTEAAWPVNADEGYMETGKGAGGIHTKDKFADFQLHLEFATPKPAKGSGQGRGNSGVLINGMYEVQVLDSYEAKTYPDGQCGAMYGQTPPLVNACKAPGEWQTYDIIFESPRWDDSGTLVKKANVTVIQNGVVLHHKHEYIGATDGIGGVPHTSLGAYLKPHAPEVFIELQDHANPVRYRNIWIRELGNYDQS
jgi:3-keto-disaccharide hydrolase